MEFSTGPKKKEEEITLSLSTVNRMFKHIAGIAITGENI